MFSDPSRPAMFYLRGDVMDFPYVPEDRTDQRRAGNPHAAWWMLAIIAVVLGAAALAAALTTDTRDFAARHHSVLATQAL
jgi:hypothetical protein